MRDSGKDVLFSAASDSARLTAMLYAKKKWGKQVVLEGSRIIRSPHDRKQNKSVPAKGIAFNVERPQGPRALPA